MTKETKMMCAITNYKQMKYYINNLDCPMIVQKYNSKPIRTGAPFLKMKYYIELQSPSLGPTPAYI